jgi:hypothetical protein
MSAAVERALQTALTGGPAKGGPRWAVTGRNVRGERFTTRPYRERESAVDFAAEVNAKGGDVRVVRA